MDIQGSATATVAASDAPGTAGAFESAALERRAAADSFDERAEAEPAATGEGVGERLDISV